MVELLEAADLARSNGRGRRVAIPTESRIDGPPSPVRKVPTGANRTLFWMTRGSPADEQREDRLVDDQRCSRSGARKGGRLRRAFVLHRALLAPLLLVVISVAGLVFGRAAAEGSILVTRAVSDPMRPT